MNYPNNRSDTVKVTGVDVREEAILAYRSTFGLLMNTVPELKTMQYRKFFADAVDQIRNNRARGMAAETLAVWVKWGNIVGAAKASCEGGVQRRLERTSTCPPGGLFTSSKTRHCCGLYACPMCWYRHLRDRLLHISDMAKGQENIGNVMRVQGVAKDVYEEIPARDKLSAVYDKIVAVREAVACAGSFSTVRLLGEPKRWKLAADMVLVFADTSKLIEVIGGIEDFEWTALPVRADSRNRTRQLLVSVAEIMKYPEGVFSPGLAARELVRLFGGDRLVRSRATGCLSASAGEPVEA